MAPAITVVIPTHDRRDTMLLALASALNQTREPVQVLVLADGCSDGTVDTARAIGDRRVEVLDLPKAPGYGYEHRNEALRRARGEVVAWLADDDLYLADHLERVGELFDAGVADLVSTPACVVHEDDRLEATFMDWGIPFYLERFVGGENRTPASAVSHTVRAALSVGGWRADLPRAADMDLWQRMLRGGARPFTTCAPTVLHFRASGREQDYADRVRQNRSFAERLCHPHTHASLRAEMDRAVQQRVAELEQRACAADQASSHSSQAAERSRTEADAAIHHAEEEIGRARTEADAAIHHAEEEIGRARTEADAAIHHAEEEAARCRAEADAAIHHAEEEAARCGADAERARQTLEAIYAGGWWRLRGHLRPVLSIIRRLTARPHR